MSTSDVPREYWPPGGSWTDNQRRAAVNRRVRTREEVLAAVRESRTQKEAGERLGVTRARVAVLCGDWKIDWHAEKKQ